MDRKKTAIIGGGNIGGTLAYLFAQQGICDVVILDRDKDMAIGKALDISQSLPCWASDVRITGTDQYQDIHGADLVIVTAGVSRKPGMSRDDLLNSNVSIIRSIAFGVREFAPDAFVIVVTNPLDAMVYAFLKLSHMSRKMVVGMAGVLDTARFKSFLATELNVSVQDVSALVLGGHGDTMVPLIKYTTIGGEPLELLIQRGMISEDSVMSIIERTRNAGGELVQLLKTGSAFYAPATSVFHMALSYLYDQRKILPCSVLLNGEYGETDICMGVPVLISKNGAEHFISLVLDQHEKTMFNNSVAAVRKLISETNVVLSGQIN